MSQQENIYMEDELSLLDVVNFFYRQKNLIFKSFVVLFSVSLVFAFTRPTIYLSEIDLLVGKNYYADTRVLIEQAYKPNETIEQIKYVYGKQADIDNVRNTNIIKIKVRNENKEVSENAANRIVASIMGDEAKQVELRKSEFLALLKVIKVVDGANFKQSLDLISEASKSYNTKILSNETTKLNFSGQLKQNLGLGFLLSIVLALCVALLKDQLSKFVSC